MAQKRRKVGHIEPAGENRWRILVSRGKLADGGRNSAVEYVEGTYDDADAACYRLASRLGRDLTLARSGMTLAQYYWHVFRESPSSRGTPRTKATLRTYDSQMVPYILPRLGDRRLDKITHADVKALVLDSTAPAKTKEVIRVVLRAAYDDGFIDEKPMERRIVAHKKRKPQMQPWSPLEAAQALEAMRGYREAEIEAYLILGLSGLRKEEAMALRPADIEARETYDIVTGETVRSLVATVRGTYSRDDGLTGKTKTEFSARSMPILVQGRERLLQIIADSRPKAGAPDLASAESAIMDWAGRRIIDLTMGQIDHHWRRACAELGLRFIPPDMLRHTSETMMQAASLPDTLVSRLHGHTELKTDYQHYMRPGLEAAERAAREVHKIMSSGT